jgi:copper chaperone CopZ
MKKLLFIILIALPAAGAMAQFRSANLQAAGLTCAMCTKAINNSLEKLSFISSVKADIQSSSFNINFKEKAEIDFDAMKNAVEKAGFSVARLKVTGIFDNVPVKNDAHVKIDGKVFHFVNVSDQTLRGEKAITLVDKNFVTAKDFKKYSASTSMSCIHTGKAGSCCAKEGISGNTRIYHVTI